MNNKKLIMILFCALSITFPALAQFQVGASVGAKLSGLSINPEVAGRNINTNSGLTAGVTLVYNFSSMIGVQLEPAYTQAGASIYSAQTEEGLILEIDQTIEMSYIALPILVKVSFPGDFITPYLLGGTNIGFPLDDTKLTIDNVTVNGEDFTSNLPNELLEQELKNESIDFGLSLGAGLSFPIGVIDMFFQAQYNLGLTDINDEEPQEGIIQDEIKTRGFEVTGGVLFTL